MLCCNYYTDYHQGPEHDNHHMFCTMDFRYPTNSPLPFQSANK